MAVAAPLVVFSFSKHGFINLDCLANAAYLGAGRGGEEVGGDDLAAIYRV